MNILDRILKIVIGVLALDLSVSLVEVVLGEIGVLMVALIMLGFISEKVGDKVIAFIRTRGY